MKNFKTIIDVRDEYEYEEGHIANSLNIPLAEIQAKLDEIRALPQPIVLCCKSGGRSGAAHQFLSQQDIDCFNAGGWEQVEQLIEAGEICWVD